MSMYERQRAEGPNGCFHCDRKRIDRSFFPSHTLSFSSLIASPFVLHVGTRAVQSGCVFIVYQRRAKSCPRLAQHRIRPS
jgi:hypothetical protein